MKKVKWAIWSTGNISTQFAEAMEYVENGEMSCVLSRTQENADAFAKKFNIPHAYDNADKMLAEGGADVVYIGTPNRVHYENMQKCIEHKKHILCEKPFTVNSKELKDVIASAKNADIFLMEAMWTQFFPSVIRAKEWLEEGRIGKPLRAYADFSVNTPKDNWRRTTEQAGGALVDVGIYCLNIADIAFGLKPTEKIGMAQVVNSVDISNSMILKYEDDQFATLNSAFDSLSNYVGLIVGETGYIELGEQFWRPNRAELFTYDGSTFGAESVELFEDPYPSTGYQYEATHVGDMIVERKTESDIMTFEKSLEMMKIMDDFRKEWGVVMK